MAKTQHPSVASTPEQTSVSPSDEEKQVMSTEGDGEINVRSILVLIGTGLTYFCSVGIMNAFGVFQEYYASGPLREKTDFDIAWIGSFSTFALFGFAAPAGFVVDKFDPRAALAFGSTCIVVALMMVSLCTEYYQFFLAQGLLMGLGMSFTALPGTAVIPKYFQKHRGLAAGFTVSGSSLGGIIWPIMFDRLINHNGVSFAWTIRAMGFMCIPILALSTVFIRPPPKVPNPSTESMADDADDAEGSDQAESPSKEKPQTKFDVIKNPTFMLLAGGLAIGYFGMFTPFFFLSTYAVDIGVSTSLSFYLISILNAASMFGRILPGFVADRYGHFNILTLAMLLAGVVAMCWKAATTTGGLIVWALAYGFASGGIMSSQLAAASRLSTPTTYGAAMGSIMASVSLTGLFGSPIAGHILPYGWIPLSMYAGATLMVGAALVFVARLRLNKNLFGSA